MGERKLSEKQRCALPECRKKCGIMKFDCPFCHNSFCINHRIPEDHKCERDIRADLQEKHKLKIMNEMVRDTKKYVAL